VGVVVVRVRMDVPLLRRARQRELLVQGDHGDYLPLYLLDGYADAALLQDLRQLQQSRQLLAFFLLQNSHHLTDDGGPGGLCQPALL
jgi:hypothetical protein